MTDRPTTYTTPLHAIACPVCGFQHSLIHVRSSIHTGPGYRRRECQRCKHVFTTKEQTQDQLRSLLNTAYELAEASTNKEWRESVIGYRIPHMGKIGDTKHFSERGE